ncbi:MAG: hypothetical protein KME29_29890 [Calothrix sp. FI2-JRJ7]|jgi:hypothetical protein|nr:hypothetical protein [Calothrix sp. FI2-JRJ7]
MSNTQVKTILILAANPKSNTVRLWKWNFDYLLWEGCVFMREHFKTNPTDVEKSEISNMCDRMIAVPNR